MSRSQEALSLVATVRSSGSLCQPQPLTLGATTSSSAKMRVHTQPHHAHWGFTPNPTATMGVHAQLHHAQWGSPPDPPCTLGSLPALQLTLGSLPTPPGAPGSYPVPMHTSVPPSSNNYSRVLVSQLTQRTFVPDF